MENHRAMPAVIAVNVNFAAMVAPVVNVERRKKRIKAKHR
jgi:hypothetical protein